MRTREIASRLNLRRIRTEAGIAAALLDGRRIGGPRASWQIRGDRFATVVLTGGYRDHRADESVQDIDFAASDMVAALREGIAIYAWPA